MASGKDRRGRALRTPSGPKGSSGKRVPLGAAGKPPRAYFNHMKNSTPPVIDYEGSDYQDKFWSRGGRAYEDQCEAIALQHLLPANGGKRLLELGAGAGRNTARYQHFEEIVLVDYSTTQLKQAVEKLGNSPRHRFFAANIYHLPFNPSSFDAATMIRTLHHMTDAPLALQQAGEALCGQATFILEYANKQNLKAILRYLLRKQSWSPFTLEAVEFVKLNFDFHPRAVRQWLTDMGFHIETQRTVSHFRLEILKKMLPVRLLAGLDSILQPSGAFLQLTPSVFLKARKEKPFEQVPDKLILRCPVCGHSPLADIPPLLTCQKCGRTYPVRDGIYDLRALNQ
jgi:ubiquinone/menaquinone biosynthesis C-methylase UbiE